MKTHLGLLLAVAALMGVSAAPVRDHDLPTAVEVIKQVNIARESPLELATLLPTSSPISRATSFATRACRAD
jgi:hypothetical protein